jgi:nicotinamidase-related amidase
MNLKDQPLLLLIDIQQGLENLAYYGGRRNNPKAEEKVAELLAFWRELSLPLIFVKHNGTPPSPLSPGGEGNDFKEIIKPVPGEMIIEKTANSAFIGTSLHEILREKGIKQLVLVGLTTSHCVSSTARMAGNYGYNTFVVSDATATFDTVGLDGELFEAELVHRITLANLNKEFATVLNTKEILELLSP